MSINGIVARAMQLKKKNKGKKETNKLDVGGISQI